MPIATLPPFDLVRRLPALALLTAVLGAGAAHAQSFCASDGQPRPAQLLERFINADCGSCWTDPATPKTAQGLVALDWVIPGSQGDDAPLSAVATRDGLARLESLGDNQPTASRTVNRRVQGLRGTRLRVAHGLPLAEYLGASIELKPVPPAAKSGGWTAWLALVETLPPGTEGSPVERNLVRNLLQTDWDGRKPVPRDAPNRFFDQRSMGIAQGVDPARLRVIGWVQDAGGRVLQAAESRCAAPTR